MLRLLKASSARRKTVSSPCEKWQKGMPPLDGWAKKKAARNAPLFFYLVSGIRTEGRHWFWSPPAGLLGLGAWNCQLGLCP